MTQQKMNVLCLIPARGGSKGVPRKNVRLLAGKPLIAYTIEVALAVKEHLHSIMVSTDDEEIAEVSRKFGAEVPFMRPAEFAADKAPMLPTIQHAIRFMENRDNIVFDWLLLLQPTEPFRRKEDLLNALELARTTDTDSIISVSRVFAHHPILMKKIVGNRLVPFCIEEIEGTRRQDYDPPAYMRNGAIYLSRRDVIMNQNSIWGNSIRPYIMDEEAVVSIDSMQDFMLAEMVARKIQGLE